MAILTTDIKFYLSGGAANANVNASIGGVVSSVEVTTATLHNLFDATTSVESLAGKTSYRCIYIKNIHGSITLQSAVAWISANTPSTDSVVAIGVGTSAINGTEQTIGNDTTPPTGVVFTAPSTIGTGLALGNLATNNTKALWIRRIISVSAAAYTTDTATINAGGDTTA